MCILVSPPYSGLSESMDEPTFPSTSSWTSTADKGPCHETEEGDD